MDGMTLEPGAPYPLGATFDGHGVNFALFAEHASAVSVCLYDDPAGPEVRRLVLPACTDGVWHGYLPGAREDLERGCYGYRVDGPHLGPGHRFDSTKLLIDPYSRALVGEFRWHVSHCQPEVDNSAWQLKTPLLVDEAFDWSGDRRPYVPIGDAILYEVHVKGFTARHPRVPAEQQGRYEGLASDAAIAHFRRLGVTTLSLLPVHACIDELPLTERGLVNYWGYNTIGYFAPDRRFARSDPAVEFKTMVKRLHAAGLEVVLDVVYNHTAEGDHRGPTLSWKGIDNLSYYHLHFAQPALYENFTGTGNALNLSHPRVLQMVMDSLRYWVEVMHVDGFRFDLATTLARGPHGFSARASFLDACRQDPVLSRVKLIAEPWDVGFGGYQVGHFPPGWSEWNDRFRDSVRSFWLGRHASRGELASRLAGSSELFHRQGRAPSAGVNFISAHDGFTLNDLVTYNHKHNEANGEDNRDGHSDNRSWNCGVEGPTQDVQVQMLRDRLKRALLATLFVSQGVPMLLAGDEIGRTQQGNNNAYCQDNEINWLDWERVDEALLTYCARLIALRKRFSQLRRRDWLKGSVNAKGQKDICWLNRQGEEMTTRQWQEPGRFAFGFILAPVDAEGTSLMVLINGEASDWPMTLPKGHWVPVLDSTRAQGQPELVDSIEKLRADGAAAAIAVTSKAQVSLKAGSVMFFEQV